MTHEVRMPVLSQSMIQGRVVEWLINEGQKVDKGALLVVVESDKATHELEAPQAGILRKILVEAGSEVEVDTPIAIIAGEDEPGIEMGAPQLYMNGELNAPSTVVPVTITGRKPISPAAKRLAKELGIDLSQVPGTGEDGLITEKDVRHYVAEPSTPVDTPVEDAQVIPLTGPRGRIAEKLSLSRHTAADVTTVMNVDMSRVVTLHGQTGCSYTAYVAWSAARALQEFPLLNAWLEEDRIVVKSAVHMGVAVARDNGLVVPCIRYIERKSVTEIDQEIDNLSARARANQLTPDDMKGSTFTLTNSGVFGSLFFTPIINLPEVAILGMGKVADTPVVRQGQVVPSKVIYLCLTYDHRAVDGSTAVQFLQSIKNRLESLE